MLLRPSLVAAAIALSAVPALAQSNAEYQEWRSWCLNEVHGQIVPGEGYGTCVPPSSASSSGSNSGYGMSPTDQMLMTMAGNVGSELARRFWLGVEQGRRRAELNRVQREWQMRQAARRAAEERERAHQLDLQRNRELLGRLRGVVGTSELGMRRIETSELRMRTTNEMFGTAANPTGTTMQQAPVDDPATLGPPPADVEGVPVAANTEAQVTALWDNYLSALDRHNQAQARMDAARASQQTAARLRDEAGQRLADARAAAAQPDAPPEAAAQAGEAEEYFSFAVDLGGQADADLSAAQTEADAAAQALAEAEAARQGGTGRQATAPTP